MIPITQRKLTIRTVNVRSIKGKEDLLIDSLSENVIDILLITESWLKRNNIEDEQWLNQSDFKKLNYKTYSIPRPSDQGGGGILLLSRDVMGC